MSQPYTNMGVYIEWWQDGAMVDANVQVQSLYDWLTNGGASGSSGDPGDVSEGLGGLKSLLRWTGAPDHDSDGLGGCEAAKIANDSACGSKKAAKTVARCIGGGSWGRSAPAKTPRSLPPPSRTTIAFDAE